MVNDDKIFNGMEEVIKSRINNALLIKGKTGIPQELIEKHTATVKLNKNEKGIGISIYNGLVCRMKYKSPFKGQINIGDIVMFLNGSLVHFEKKDNVQSKHFGTLAQEMLSKDSPTLEIGFIRLKSRLLDVPVPKGFTATEDYKTDTVFVYLYSFMKFGLHVQKVMGTAIVSYTTPISISSISFNIGETILTVDDKKVDCIEQIKERIREGCIEKGFARVTVTYPAIDILRNSVRNQINTAAREIERPIYSIGEDARKFAQSGITAVKTAAEPKSILRLTKKQDATPTGDVNSKQIKTSLIGFRNSVGEHDIPSEWNSKLFVWLPPMKTADSEKNGGFQASSVYKKPLN